MLNKNILTVTNLIKLLSLEELKRKEIVENLIKTFGLVQWGPDVFGEDEQYKNLTVDMAGIYQIPAQLAGALIRLSSEQISSYCEIGVFQGGNFVFVSEYLKRFNPEIMCTGIDPSNYLNKEIRAYIDANDNWMEFKQVTSDDISGTKFDLVFIDGNHVDGWVEKDYENLGKYAKICLIHDIQEKSCQEVIDFWEKIKQGKTTEEYLECFSPEPIMGIGMILQGKESKRKAK